MDTPIEYAPARRWGITFYTGISLILLAASVYLFIYSLDRSESPYFILTLLGSVIIFIPLPFILYSAFSLWRARYLLDRNGLRLRWGLRSEDIPMPDIEWVRPLEGSGVKLVYPTWSFTGILRGLRPAPDAGEVEFFATQKSKLLLIATPKRIFAISPTNPSEFLIAFQRTFEFGSVSPITPQSTQAGTFLGTIWNDARARWLLISAVLLMLALLVVVILLIPTYTNIFIGYTNPTTPAEPVPAIRLFILPVLSLFSLIMDILLSFFFFRREGLRPLSYFILSSSILTSLLLFAALLFIQ